MLELVHGHAPFSKLPPIKVLLLTLQVRAACLSVGMCAACMHLCSVSVCGHVCMHAALAPPASCQLQTSTVTEGQVMGPSMWHAAAVVAAVVQKPGRALTAPTGPVAAPQGPPPQLEAECGGRHFSRGMREVVASCLNKDPAKRPTAKQLLSKG